MCMMDRIAWAAALIAGLAVTANPAASGSRDRAGDFDYYALVLSWSPTYCEGAGSDRAEPQCDGKRPYAFVLHGLWPQYESGYPESCEIGRKPWVPKSVIRAMLDIMPSERLVIHEFKKHGTCSGLQAEDYFGLSRRLFGQITVPARYAAAKSELHLTPKEITDDFLAANPQLTAAMISVDCAKKGRLRELHVCFSKEGLPRACGKNEERGSCRASTVTLPPIRGKTTGDGDM